MIVVEGSDFSEALIFSAGAILATSWNIWCWEVEATQDVFEFTKCWVYADSADDDVVVDNKVESVLADVEMIGFGLINSDPGL